MTELEKRLKRMQVQLTCVSIAIIILTISQGRLTSMLDSGFETISLQLRTICANEELPLPHYVRTKEVLRAHDFGDVSFIVVVPFNPLAVRFVEDVQPLSVRVDHLAEVQIVTGKRAEHELRLAQVADVLREGWSRNVWDVPDAKLHQ
jgi:hypothetical protein